MPLKFDSPRDDNIRWLRSVEDEVAAFVSARLVKIAREATQKYWASLTAPEVITAAGDLAVFDIIPIRWTDFVTGELVETFGGIHVNGAVSTWIQAPTTAALPSSTAIEWASVVNTNAVNYAATASNRMIGVGDRLWADISSKVSAGIESGDVRDRLVKTLQETTDLSRARAELVARTEVTAAYNAGNLEGALALGEFGPTEKVWITGLDDRVRPTHAAAEAQGAIPINDTWQVGMYQMRHPGDFNAGPEEVCRCRCSMLELYPGDVRPNGTVVPEPVSRTPSSSQAQTSETPLTVDEPISVAAIRPGRASVRTLAETIKLPAASRGRVAERVEALTATTRLLDKLHGSTGVMPEIDVRLGGVAGRKGGHFATATRGSKPKRVRGESYEQRLAKVQEYNSRPARPEILINDFDIPKQMSDFTHEVGHAMDWDGNQFRSIRAWRSSEAQALQSKYRADWLNHVDEISDPETRLFLQLAREVREAESVATYLRGKAIDHRQYFTSIEEVWARSYAQFVAEVTTDPRLLSNISEMAAMGYQFSEAEFVRIKPLIEGILRTRGLIE
jgi:hypothetical protein